MSTTFSLKKRISQPLEKRLKKQRDFEASKLPRSPRERFGVATFLTYRFASQASSVLWASKVRFSTPLNAAQPSQIGSVMSISTAQCVAM
jgi:hypothetical protein